MADDAVTRLVVEGGSDFVRVLTQAARAQEQLTQAIANASQLRPTQINTAVQEAAQHLQAASTAAQLFRERLTATGQSEETVNRLTRAIQGQSKALLENVRNVEEAERADERRKTRLQVAENAIREERSNTLFRASAPRAITEGPLNVNTAKNQQQAVQLAQGIGAVDQAQQGATRSGVSYLSNLSALHAGSFLLTGTTFSAGQSIATLGLAFSKMGVEVGGFNKTAAAGGAVLGLLALAIHGVFESVSLVISIVEQGAQTLLKFGAAGAAAVGAVVVASTKLASNVENAFAEIAAFGSPTVAQFSQLEEKVSSLARTFGTAAQGVAEGASLFIRAGGDVETAINGGARAVVLLQTASRGELIPSTAARSIVTVTNAFKQFDVTATQAADIIVGTAQKTALSFNEVTQAFQQAAPEAAQLKIPLLDLSTIIGVLANQGLRGQVAGTGLKQVLLDLLKPSKEAAAKLQEYNVSIQDSAGKIRPFRDVLIDLNKAFGASGEGASDAANAAREQAQAVIFGSRANLAAAIIARTGADDELKTAIGAVSAEQVVAILQSTTSAQVNILKTNIEELARAFGGPLNVGIGAAVKGLNSFFTGSEEADARTERLRKDFELVGQAVLAVFTGQGFGPIQDRLNQLDNSKASEFFTGLLNAALTVRNAVVNDLIPAFQTAGQNISAAIGGTDIDGKFNGITAAIVALISAGGRLIVFTSQLVSDFITGNTRGQEIRETFSKIADTVRTTLAAAFAVVATQIIIGVAAIRLFGGALQQLVGAAAAFEKAQSNVNVIKLGESATSAAKNLGSTADELSRVRAQIAGFKQEQENLVGPRTGGVDDAALPSREAMDRAFQIRDDILPGLLKKEAELILQQQKLGDVSEAANAALTKGQEAGAGPFQRIQQDIDNIKFDNITNFLEGDLPSSLTALAGNLSEIDKIFNRGTTEPAGSESAFPVDPKKAEQVARQITDITRRAAEERNNILEDAGIREIELQRSTLDRLTDLATAFHRNERKLDEETDKRIKQSNIDFVQQREDRDNLQVISRGLERESFLRDQANARRDQGIAKADAAEDRSNQRRVQDQDRIVGIIENREQHLEDVRNQIADRAFQRSQQDTERRFSLTQDRESTAFERQLQDQATRRDNTRRLSEAKSPTDRTQINRDIAQQKLDTTFSRSQDEQRTRFRIQQDEARIKFSRSQEDVAFARTLTNEQAAFEFRVALEIKFQAIKRGLEDIEIGRQTEVDQTRLGRSQTFGEQDFRFRLTQADKLQAAQDELANQQHERQNQRTLDEAATRKRELGQKFVEDVFGIFDDADRQRLKNQEQSLRQLSKLTEREQRNLTQLAEREPTAAGGAAAAITRLNLELITMDLLFKRNTLDAEDLFHTIRDRAITGEGLVPEAPSRSATFALPSFPTEVQQQITQAQRIDVSPLLLQVLPAAVVAGIRQAQLQGQGNRSVTIQGGVINSDGFLPLLQRLLTMGR